MTIRIRAALLVVLLALTVLAGQAAAQCGSPRIDCPSDISVTACHTDGASVDYPVPTAFNDCGPLTATLEFGPPPGAVFPLGTTNVGYMVVDANGSVARCDFQVTVTLDLGGLQITCPDDITVVACEDGGATVTYDQPTATSSCGPIQTFLYPGFEPFASGALFPVGTTTVRWRTDQSLGTYQECAFQVTVLPLIAGLRCFGDTTVTTCDPAGAIVDYPIPTANSPCGPLQTFLVSGPAPGSLFPIGTTPIQWGAPLPDGGTAICYKNVTVELGLDTEPPLVECPDAIVVVAAPGQPTATATWEVQATDNCPGAVTLESTPPSGSMFPCGTTPVTVTARDAAGNESVCTFNVIVAVPAPLDIKPGSCPNPLKSSEAGVLPVALMASPDFDIARIDPSSVRLEGVPLLRWLREDAGAPYLPMTGKDDCLDCRPSKKDRVADLAFKFDARTVVAALGDVQDRECRVVRLTATTIDGCPVVGEDVVLILADDRAVAATGESIDAEPAPAPRAPALHPARPNPLAGSTRIAYELPAAAHARLDIYDVSGRRVRTLANAEHAAGLHEQEWDGADESGSPVAGGIYFHVLTVAGESPSRQTGKVLVVR
jgi:hypothetical protein